MGMEKEASRYSHKEIPGYSGEKLESLPVHLRQRVEAAAKSAISGEIGAFSVNLFEKPQQEWAFGEYTDVFITDDGHYYKSYHREQNRFFSIFITGMGESHIVDQIGQSLGFNPETADIISGYGWINDVTATATTKKYYPSGPYYGQKI